MKPPVLATWLLIHLVPDEGIAGDLLESFTERRSRAWYWRQVLVAILTAVAKDVRTHKLLAIRALVIGQVLYLLFSFPFIWLGRTINDWLSKGLSETTRSSFWWAFFGTMLVSDLLVFIACAISGWILARLNGRHAPTMVFIYAASVFVFEYAVVAEGFFRHDGQLPVPAWALVLGTFLVIGRPLSILLGGLWGSPPTLAK